MVTGDKAVRLRWVSDLVERMAEDSIETLPREAPPAAVQVVRVGGESGPARQALPVLQPGDAWLIHDPQGIYLER